MPEKPYIGNVKANVRGCYYVAGPNTPDDDPDNNPQTYTYTGAIYANTPPNVLALNKKNEVYLGRKPRGSGYTNTDNYADLDADSQHDGGPLRVWTPISTTVIERSVRITWPITYIPISEQSPQAAYWSVVGTAGAHLYFDNTDMRIIGDVMTRPPGHGLIYEPPASEMP